MEKEISPFAFGHIVNLQAFTNREDDVQRLKKNVYSGINTILISPRRWGKTSLVVKTCTEVQKENPDFKIVQLDLFSCSNEREFLENYAKEVLKASSEKWEEWVTNAKELFQSIIPKISFGIQPESDFSLSFEWKDAEKNITEILALPEVLAQKKGCKILICIDEFQNLAQYSDYKNFEKKLRASWQTFKHCVFCLYGSKRHLMTQLFNDASAPFYRFGDLFFLDKIKTEKWIPFIVENFKKTKKEIPTEWAEKIPMLMKNHSWYVQQFSYYVWSETTSKVDENTFNFALNRLIQSNVPLYQQLIEGLSSGQINLIKAIIKQETQLSAKATLEKYRLGTSANVTKNKEVLLQRDLIHKSGELFELLDPVFELWFQQVFFNESISNK
ncbi:MAG: ATP-binding protein [Bacteroidetes bacterium]|nr:ATP-binding protein [Bacteroidota bacterium]